MNLPALGFCFSTVALCLALWRQRVAFLEELEARDRTIRGLKMELDNQYQRYSDLRKTRLGE